MIFFTFTENPFGWKTFCIKNLDIRNKSSSLTFAYCCYCCCCLVWRMTWHDEDNRLESGFCLLDTSIKIKVTNFGACAAKQLKSNVVMTFTKIVHKRSKQNQKLLNLMEPNQTKPNHNFLIAMPFAVKWCLVCWLIFHYTTVIRIGPGVVLNEIFHANLSMPICRSVISYILIIFFFVSEKFPLSADWVLLVCDVTFDRCKRYAEEVRKCV